MFVDFQMYCVYTHTKDSLHNLIGLLDSFFRLIYQSLCTDLSVEGKLGVSVY